ncbi:cryptococcal mannosyltransferase 1-domain-containing protein [Trichophaea hybrida]|nr:cryptococcal mannosyltransferase 1-domain-containing protein [Trichophaea hybrida]
MPTSWVPDPQNITRVLFLNDVIFSPLELLHLLFSTNSGSYAAACAIDYINPFKYYDTFATRDPDGYPLGLPFFPYFATPSPQSQILSTSPEVSVRSCWGGVIALNATFFTREKDPILFRSEPEPYWDSSECCLVNADIDQPEKTFINPFVRCAYDRSNIRLASGYELAPWDAKVKEVRWDGSKWVDAERIAGKGGWCGGRKLLVMNEERKEGERGWRNVEVPVVPGR